MVSISEIQRTSASRSRRWHGENIDLDAAVVDTFNKKSEEAGFPERL